VYCFGEGSEAAYTRVFASMCRVVSPAMLRKRLLDSSRGRVVTLLRDGALTVEEISRKLSLTPNAVRAQLTAMERDGVVRSGGLRAGTTRPFHLFELTPEVEQLLSRAYVPLLAQLVETFAEALPVNQTHTLLRDAGRGLAEELSAGRRPSGTLRSRVIAASEMMNEHLGALTHVVENGALIIQGNGCPLAALTGKHPAVCLAMEAFVADIVGTRTVRECCDRSTRPRCCFEVRPDRVARARSTKRPGGRARR